MLPRGLRHPHLGRASQRELQWEEPRSKEAEPGLGGGPGVARRAACPSGLSVQGGNVIRDQTVNAPGGGGGGWGVGLGVEVGMWVDVVMSL